jgi:ParB family chromosome partitioning protein
MTGYTDMVATGRIVPHPLNPRQDLGDVTDLADNIEKISLLSPVTVAEYPKRPGWFIIIDGHRRHKACVQARIKAIPVTVHEPPRTGTEAVLWMLMADFHHEQLNPVDRARALGKLRDNGLKPAQIAASLGVSASVVSYHLELLHLTAATQQRIIQGQVAAGVAHKAVKDARRGASGRRRGRPAKVSIEQEHFSYRHPLADDARTMCELAGHTGVKYGRGRTGDGKIACGVCWEKVIRQDAAEGGRLRIPTDTAGNVTPIQQKRAAS